MQIPATIITRFGLVFYPKAAGQDTTMMKRTLVGMCISRGVLRELECQDTTCRSFGKTCRQGNTAPLYIILWPISTGILTE